MEYQGEWEQSVPAADALDSIKSTVRAWAADSNPVETRGQEDIDELSAISTAAPASEATAPAFTSDDLAGNETLTDDGAIRRGDFIISHGLNSEPPLIVTDASGNHHHTAMIADIDQIRQFIDIWQEDRNSIGHDDPLISATDMRVERQANGDDASADTITARQIRSNRASRPGIIHYAGTFTPTTPASENEVPTSSHAIAVPTPPSFTEAMETMLSATSDGQYALDIGIPTKAPSLSEESTRSSGVEL